MSDLELLTALEAIAESDMRAARKRGRILIGETKIGTVALAYDKASRTYSITAQGMASFANGVKTYCHLKAADCVTRLQDLYDVVVA